MEIRVASILTAKAGFDSEYNPQLVLSLVFGARYT
jgi:hypothetical protein